MLQIVLDTRYYFVFITHFSVIILDLREFIIYPTSQCSFLTSKPSIAAGRPC